MLSRILIERNIDIPLRDGVITKADIYRPDTDDSVPVILSRTPYGKDNKHSPNMHSFAIDAFAAVDRGYAVAFQDVRGRYGSEGVFNPYFQEQADGYDSIEWLAEQAWCDGSIGMTGGSYLGAAQWLAAIAQPPHLKAIVPSITGSGFYEGWTYQGGALQWGFLLLWALSGLATNEADRQGADHDITRLLAAVDKLEGDYVEPSATVKNLLHTYTPYFFNWLKHHTNDAFWQPIDISQLYTQVKVPVLNIGGWYDIFINGTVDNFHGMQTSPDQYLLIGPWAHGDTSANFPGRRFSIHSNWEVVDITGLQLAFFDRYLKQQENALSDQAPVNLYIMGEESWRDEQEWPLARTEYTVLYLDAEGMLSAQKPTATDGTDTYTYHPDDPFPTVGGATFLPGLTVSDNAGPRDQSTVGARPDVLVYSMEPLVEALEVTGPIRMTLYAASSVVDTDFVIRLCDVHPDGASRLLTEGIIRARFRNGFEQEAFLQPGKVYEFQINVGVTSNVFLPGHSISVMVSSSSFPRFTRNPNTGAKLDPFDVSKVVPAQQRIYRSMHYPSNILLPIIPRQ